MRLYILEYNILGNRIFRKGLTLEQCYNFVEYYSNIIKGAIIHKATHAQIKY